MKKLWAQAATVPVGTEIQRVGWPSEGKPPFLGADTGSNAARAAYGSTFADDCLCRAYHGCALQAWAVIRRRRRPQPQSPQGKHFPFVVFGDEVSP